ncbi:MAG: phenylalanine--tRNA ligase subunit beta [Pseudomonadota bacterium]
MKFSQRWLESIVGTELDTEFLLERLTLAGLEVDGCEALTLDDKVVVAKVVSVEQHPDADKLKVCQVFDGTEQHTIVCGAPNVREGLVVALAQIGAKLPGGLKIRKSKLRGVASAGMLCSGRELELGEDHDGILELPEHFQIGRPLAEFYDLPDKVIDVDLTPNRGDCFSLLGIAREVATFSGKALDAPSVAAPITDLDQTYAINVSAADGAPVFTLRVVRDIDPNATTPTWMVERLRRSGVRSIHPVVDITNYVMLEFGQPMHAYDLEKLTGDISVRRSKANEMLVLLDGREVSLPVDTLVIADDSGPIGLAGIMGGEGTGVTTQTRHVVFEAAWFTPAAMAGQARQFGLHTDASMRFERGVDPTQQLRAQERAAELLQQIAGGSVGPVNSVTAEAHLPTQRSVSLRAFRLAGMLGVSVSGSEVDDILARLGLTAARTDDGWSVEAPAFRFDIAIEEDLIEEVARVYGYDRVPAIRARGDAILASAPEAVVTEDWVRDALAARGFNEIISYSFVDPQLHAEIDIAPPGPKLLNPISSELSVMRGSLLPGMLSAADYNAARQQSSLKLFEIGHVFRQKHEPNHLGLLMAGEVGEEHWDGAPRTVDFFDVKAELEVLLKRVVPGTNAIFEPLTESGTLHPGQAAQVRVGEHVVGYVGMLHPALASVHFEGRVAGVFEINLNALTDRLLPAALPISKFPSVRRDLALLVDDEVPAGALVATARESAGVLLHNAFVFDVYRGKGVEPGLKSVALGLILLDSSSTLTDEQIAATVSNLTRDLAAAHGAKVRE